MLNQVNTSTFSETLYKCNPCNKIFKTMEQMESHQRSKNHKKSEKEYLQNNHNMSQSSLFQNITMEKKEPLQEDESILANIDNEEELN